MRPDDVASDLSARHGGAAHQSVGSSDNHLMNVVVDQAELRRLHDTLAPAAVTEMRAARLTQRAVEALRDRDWVTALSLAQAALLLDSDDAVALRTLGAACLRKGLRDEARMAFERAVEEDPADWTSAVELVNLHHESGNSAAARGYVALLTSHHGIPNEVLRSLVERVGHA